MRWHVGICGLIVGVSVGAALTTAYLAWRFDKQENNLTINDDSNNIENRTVITNTLTLYSLDNLPKSDSGLKSHQIENDQQTFES